MVHLGRDPTKNCGDNGTPYRSRVPLLHYEVTTAVGERTAIAAFVLSRVANYWPAFGDRASIVLRRMVTRPASRQYWFEVRTRRATRSIVVKVPTRIGRPPGSARLPLSPPVSLDHTTRAEREYQALTTIEKQFNGLHDDRFGVVRPLDYISELNATITEGVRAISMKRTFRRVSRFHPLPPPPALPAALSNSGAWLREYQKLPASLGSVRTTRDDFMAAIEELCYALGPISQSKAFLSAVPSQIDGPARQLLPSFLPLGAAHGDFGQSNVLLDKTGRIYVLDTAGGWHVPVFEDLAYFVVGMECSRLQILTDGVAFSVHELALARQAFLRGYFGGEGEPPAFQLYEILLVLEKWAAELRKVRSRGGSNALRRRLLNRWFRKHCTTLLKNIG